MTETMRAYQLVGWRQPAEFRDVPIPHAGPGQAVIKIGGVGLCHTDELFFHAEPGAFPYPLPFTLGHENAGWIVELGEGAAGRLQIGDPVITYASSPCGVCPFCTDGAENLCPQAWIGRGFGHDGGLAEYMLVDDARHLIALGDLDPRLVGPLSDAGTTSLHAVNRALPALRGAGTAIVIGAGGLGGYAIQWLRASSSARIIAVDVAEHRLAYASELGADITVLSDGTVDEQLSELTAGFGAEVVLDFVGADDTMATAARAVKRRGSVGIIGAGGGTLAVAYGTLPFEADLWYSQASTLADLREVVSLAQAGKVRVEVEPFPFEQTPEAYAAMAAATTRSRAVVQVGTAP